MLPLWQLLASQQQHQRAKTPFMCCQHQQQVLRFLSSTFLSQTVFSSLFAEARVDSSVESWNWNVAKMHGCDEPSSSRPRTENRPRVLTMIFRKFVACRPCRLPFPARCRPFRPTDLSCYVAYGPRSASSSLGRSMEISNS